MHLTNFSRNPHLLAQLSLLLSALGWGISGQLIQTALAEITATQIIFWRFVVATFFALLSLVFMKSDTAVRDTAIRNTAMRLKSRSESDFISSLLLSLPLVIVYYAATYAVRFTTPTTVAFIAGASVLLVPLMESFTKGKLPTSASLIEATIAFIGLGIIALQGSTHLQINTGILLSLFNAIGYAAYIVLAERRLDRVTASTLTRINGLQYLWVAIISGAVSIAITLPSWTALLTLPSWTTLIALPSWKTVFAVVGLGIFSTYLPFTLQLKAQQVLSPARASQLLATIPLFTAALASLLGQVPTNHTLIGGALIVLSILLPSLQRRRGLIKRVLGICESNVH